MSETPLNSQAPSKARLKTIGLVVGYDVPLCQLPDLDLTCGQPHRFNAPNGLGKTTLFRTLLGLQTAFAGQYKLLANAHSYLPASNALPDLPTVRQVLGTWRQIEPTTDQAQDEAIDSLGLRPLLDHPIKNLSSGQARRLALVRVMASEADVIILDEPFAGVDAAYSDRIANWIAEAAKTRLVLYVAHDRSVPGSGQIDLAPFTDNWSVEP